MLQRYVHSIFSRLVVIMLAQWASKNIEHTYNAHIIGKISSAHCHATSQIIYNIHKVILLHTYIVFSGDC